MAAGREALYRQLIQLRATELVPLLEGTRSLTSEVVGPKAILARWRLGDGAVLTIASNLAAGSVPLVLPAGELLFASTAVSHGTLPGHCTCVLLDRPRSTHG
jgi:maltooligosyltrehalose trehalohydrolase